MTGQNVEMAQRIKGFLVKKPKRIIEPTLGELKQSGSRGVEVGGREYIETVEEKRGADGVIETHVDYKYPKPKRRATSRYNAKTGQWEKLM